MGAGKGIHEKPDYVYLSSAHRTAVEPMNIAERLFGKFMNWTVFVKKTTTVSNRELYPKPPFS